jgi:hypothetical protein
MQEVTCPVLQVDSTIERRVRDFRLDTTLKQVGMCDWTFSQPMTPHKMKCSILKWG